MKKILLVTGLATAVTVFGFADAVAQGTGGYPGRGRGMEPGCGTARMADLDLTAEQKQLLADPPQDLAD